MIYELIVGINVIHFDSLEQALKAWDDCWGSHLWAISVSGGTTKCWNMTMNP